MQLRLAYMLITDALLALAALYTAVALRLGVETLRQEWLEGQALKISVIFVGSSLLSSYLMEVYSLPKGNSKWNIFIDCLQCGCAGFFFLAIIYYLEPNLMLGRGVLFLSIAVFCIYQFVWHLVSAPGKHRPRFTKRVLILGAGDIARELGELVAADRLFTLAGYLECTTDKKVEREELATWPAFIPRPLVEMQGDLLTTARKEKADLVVVALSERRGVLPLQDMMQCQLNGIEIFDAPTFYEILQGKLMLEHITPGWMICSAGFRSPALVNVYKRCIDIVMSLAGLILAAPFLPLAALAIKLDSAGPLFSKQVCVGSSEKPFLLYKFRSTSDMGVKSGAGWVVEDDSTLTWVGRFFRNTHIDGIPQLYNVLKGDMSCIGPRPEGLEFVRKLNKDIYHYSKRHTIKPGLTGWAQVRHPHGLTADDTVEKLCYDLYYIKNLSLLLDSQIMFETVKVALFGRGGR